MEPESSSDSEEKKPDLHAMKVKGKGKKPMDRAIVSGVEIITQKAKGIRIDDSKVHTDIAAKSKGKGKGKGKADTTTSSDSKGKQMENVVKSCYSLRSGPKGMDIDVKPTRTKDGKIRIGRFVVECKASGGKRRHRNDDEKDDKDGTGERTTRSASKKMKKVNSV